MQYSASCLLDKTGFRTLETGHRLSQQLWQTTYMLEEMWKKHGKNGECKAAAKKTVGNVHDLLVVLGQLDCKARNPQSIPA